MRQKRSARLRQIFNLQNALHQAGVLVHLLFYMFNYDFTLEEGGVEKENESNQQEVANNLARICVRACARLAGFNETNTLDKDEKQITSEEETG